MLQCVSLRKLELMHDRQPASRLTNRLYTPEERLIRLSDFSMHVVDCRRWRLLPSLVKGSSKLTHFAAHLKAVDLISSGGDSVAYYGKLKLALLALALI